MRVLIKEGRFANSIKTLYLSRFRLYREILTPRNASYGRVNVFLSTCLLGMCLNALYEVNLTTWAFWSAQRTRGTIWSTQNLCAELLNDLYSLLAPRVHSANHASRSPSLRLRSTSACHSYRSQMNLSATKHASRGRAIPTIGISGFKPWLSSLPWLCGFLSL